MNATAHIALGTNLSFAGLHGAALLEQALEALSEAGMAVVAKSGVWRSPAWPPGADQPDYFNAVAVVRTALDPLALYAALVKIERAFGRDRRERWASRTLDLDIVAMDGFVGRFGDLVLPHPRAHERAFVLAPLMEVAPDWRHPVSGKAASALLGEAPGGAVRVGELR